ncbi:MAG: hypothetical protein CM15mP98_10690 [Paracoccaceae bacterium]|nr:MAG: hypothetical protein CM15mP98_10690 [Paracoccaceae bacterium]
MHQGNLKCRNDGTLIVMDFGIMGRIDEYTRKTYAEILIGFLRRDYLELQKCILKRDMFPKSECARVFSSPQISG